MLFAVRCEQGEGHEDIDWRLGLGERGRFMMALCIWIRMISRIGLWLSKESRLSAVDEKQGIYGAWLHPRFWMQGAKYNKQERMNKQSSREGFQKENTRIESVSFLLPKKEEKKTRKREDKQCCWLLFCKISI